MRIALHDSDKTNFPNLVLMKLAAHHKSQGDVVGWYDALETPLYDRIYSSKVFTFTDEDPYLPPDTVQGGTGYDIETELPDEIEHVMPDYNIYGVDYSVGFLTRGCPRKCDWCVVPGKEGKPVPHADIEEFTKHREVVLLDNNVLSIPHGIQQIEKIISLDLKVDFNQGLDARLVDDGVARLLSKVSWRSTVRLACDHMGMMPSIEKAVQRLRWHNVTPSRYFCYVLVKDIDDALERIRFLKGMNVDPFAQPYISPSDPKPPTREQAALARWCNMKAEFKSRTWEDYARAKGVAA